MKWKETDRKKTDCMYGSQTASTWERSGVSMHSQKAMARAVIPAAAAARLREPADMSVTDPAKSLAARLVKTAAKVVFMPVLTRASWVAARASVDAAATAQVNFSVLTMEPVASMLVVCLAISPETASVRAVPAVPLAV